MLPELEKQASDPKTPLKQLQYLAQNYPQLRPAIAANPSTYPALLDWLSEFHEPSIDKALEERLEREKARALGKGSASGDKRIHASDTGTSAKITADEKKPTTVRATTQDAHNVTAGQQKGSDTHFGVTLPEEDPAGIVDRSRGALTVGAAGAASTTGLSSTESATAASIDESKSTAQAKTRSNRISNASSKNAESTDTVSIGAGIGPGVTASASKELNPTLTKVDSKAIDAEISETDSRGRRRRAATATAGAAGAAGASTAAASAHDSAASAHDSAASTTTATGALTKLQPKKTPEPHEEDHDEDYGSEEEKHSVLSRIVLWIVGIIIILALIAAGIAVAVFTNSWPMGSSKSDTDAYQTIDPDSKNAKDAGKEKDSGKNDDKDGKDSSTVKAPKKGTSLTDASSGDANGNGVPDAKEQGSKGVSLDFQNQDRLIVPAPEDQSIKRPVPEGAVTNLTKFGSSDGNIQCAIGAGGVQCALNKPASTLDIGNNGLPIQITFNQKLETEVIALANPVAKTAEANLAAGAAVTQGQFVCEGTNGKGVNCWDTKSGHGFTMEPTQLVSY